MATVSLRFRSDTFIFVTVVIFLVSLPASAVNADSYQTSAPHRQLWKSCGGVGDMCMCQGDTADCSRNGGKLTYVPRLPPSITRLLFFENGLRSIEKDDFFQNVSGIVFLELSLNGLSRISDGAFRGLSKLKTLDLSFNKLSYRALLPALASPVLEELYLINCSLGPIPDDLFYKTPMPTLKHLEMSSNPLRKLNMSAFVPLVNLGYLSVMFAQVREFHPDYVPSLQRLSLSDNQLLDFPISRGKDGQSLFPNLEILWLTRNNIGAVDTDVVYLPRLVWLDLRSNRFTVFRPRYFSGVSFPGLKLLSLEQMIYDITMINHEAFSNPSLRVLSLKQNGLDFSSADIDARGFSGCQNVAELRLDGNVLSSVPESKFQAMFSLLRSLVSLNMGSTKLHAVRSGMFENATLLQNLSLHDNQLTVIPDGTFDDMQYLTTLRLDGNLLTSVSKGTFSPDSRSRLTSLNLSHNPFECTCALMWFRDWLVSDPELFDYHNPYSQYICSNLPGTDITSFHMSEQQCLLSHETYVFSVVCVAVLIITVTASSLLYRYRWHIRLVLYEVHRGDPKARWRRRRPEEFQYDLFVSYSGEDVRWVIDHLIPVLEQQVGLRLCVHQRDFIVGNNITDNIVDSLAVSKRVLALFSPRFAKSHWCHFELEVCLRHVIENNDAMVIVILEDVSPRDMSGAMSALLKTTTYIRWEEELEARTSFWRRLQLALNDILPG